MKYDLHRSRRERTGRWTARGMDLRAVTNAKATDGRFSYMENVWRDPKRSDAVRTVPGFRTRFCGDNSVYGIHFYENAAGETETLVHCGNRLLRLGERNRFADWANTSIDLPEDTTIGQREVHVSLVSGFLSLASADNHVCHLPLVWEQPIVRGSYTFLAEGETAYSDFHFLLATSDGRQARVGVGEPFSFAAESDVTLTLWLALTVPAGAPLSWDGRLTLADSTGGSTCLYEGMAHQNSTAFQMGGCCYLLDGSQYLVYDGESVAPVSGHIPATLYQTADGKRTVRQRNLLSPRFYNYFAVTTSAETEDGLSYRLSDRAADAEEVSYLHRDGSWRVLDADAYRVENGFVVLTSQYNFDNDAHDLQVPDGMDFRADYNLRVRAYLGEDLTVSPAGTFSFQKAHGGLSLSENITRCRYACVHEGRVFLAGNPSAPACLFYSDVERPDFFGSFDYVSDDGAGAICGLTASGDTLTVSLVGNGVGGVICTHTGKNSADPIHDRVFPGTPTANGMYAAGGVQTFAAEPVFWSEGGLYAVNRINTFGERKVLPRSTYLGAKNAEIAQTFAQMCVFDGLLCVLTTDGTLYFGDTRGAEKDENGILQYEWFAAREVGIFRDVTFATDGTPTGGTFLPARMLAAGRDTLWFGCEDGSVCAFWFDKRQANAAFAPECYTRDGRPYRSLLCTLADDADAPALCKHTLPHSTVVRTGAEHTAGVQAFVRTDRRGTVLSGALGQGGFDFRGLCFADVLFTAAEDGRFALAEPAGGWMHKQYIFVAEGFGASLALSELVYSYRLGGYWRAEERL